MHPIYLFNYLNSTSSTIKTTITNIIENNNDNNLNFNMNSTTPPSYYDLSYTTIPYEPSPPFTLTSLNYIQNQRAIIKNLEEEEEEDEKVDIEGEESLLLTSTELFKQETIIREREERWSDEKVSIISALDMDYPNITNSSNTYYNLKKG